MSGFLLDTNTLSEMTREAPNPRVLAFLTERIDLWIPTIVLHELEYGIQLLPAGRRRVRLRMALAGIIAEHEERILPLARDAAERAAELRARARLDGHVVDVGDALIAGTASIHALTVATRNVSDFIGLGIDVLNPWEGP